jgi:hypothetical protein
VGENRNTLPVADTTEQTISDANARLVARLKQILDTPGISDKDRKLVERNLQRILTSANAG